jgi:hypothetical protein
MPSAGRAAVAMTSDGVLAHRCPRMIGGLDVVGQFYVIAVVVIFLGEKNVGHLPGWLEMSDRVRGKFLEGQAAETG